MQWKDRRTRLEFQLIRGRMVIRQDGRTLAEAPAPLARPDPRGSITWGNGMFGPLSGRIVGKGTVDPGSHS